MPVRASIQLVETFVSTYLTNIFTKMNESLKNPFVVFIAGLLTLWLVYYLLKLTIGLFWVVVLAFVILYFVNDRFRSSVRTFFNGLFNR